MKTCSLFIVLCVIIQDSDAYSKTAFIVELNIFVLLALPMIWHFRNLSIALKN